MIKIVEAARESAVGDKKRGMRSLGFSYNWIKALCIWRRIVIPFISSCFWGNKLALKTLPWIEVKHITKKKWKVAIWTSYTEDERMHWIWLQEKRLNREGSRGGDQVYLNFLQDPLGNRVFHELSWRGMKLESISLGRLFQSTWTSCIGKSLWSLEVPLLQQVERMRAIRSPEKVQGWQELYHLPLKSVIFGTAS